MGMEDGNDVKAEPSRDDVKRIVAKATEHAKFKSARLKKLKERHEFYLAVRRAEMGLEADDEFDDEVTREL